MDKKNYAVIFDFDGLIVDTEPLYLKAMQKMAKKRGKTFTLDLKREVMGAGGLISMSIMKKALDLSETPQELLEERETNYQEFLYETGAIPINRDAPESGVKPMPGLFNAITVINNLCFKKAIASSSRFKFIEFALKKLNIGKEFDVIAYGEEVANGKPAPDIFILALKKLQLTADRCIVLEDTITGVKSAKGAGIKCVAIPNQYNKNTDFSLANLVLNSLEELTESVIKKLLNLPAILS